MQPSYSVIEFQCDQMLEKEGQLLPKLALKVTTRVFT